MTNSLRLRGSDPWYRESACGKWRIVRVMIRDVPRYEVWRLAGGWRLVRANFPTYAEASEHAEGLRAVPELDLEANAAPGAIA